MSTILEKLKPYIDDPTCDILFQKDKVTVYWPKDKSKEPVVILRSSLPV